MIITFYAVVRAKEMATAFGLVHSALPPFAHRTTRPLATVKTGI